jgi:asparagine synthase (glutamine-hydrolysing)
MKRWFCGFSSAIDSSLTTLPKPLNGEMLWEGANPFWVCGNWGKQQIITLFEGPVRLAIVGTCLERYESLVELFQNAVKKHDYSRLMRLPGNYNLIVQDEADTYVFADVAGLKPVFYTVYDSCIVYSSSGVALQQLINSQVDLSWLATYLVFLTRPPLEQNRSPFCNVHSVSPGHYLKISSGKPTCKRYWYEPQEYSSFSEAAEQLREQLLTAVEGRMRLYGNVTSDLSGGFDSTSLALIAAKSLTTQEQKLHTITFKTIGAIQSEDVKWAEHAISLYPNIAAVMLEEHELPMEYSNFAEYSNLESIHLTDVPNTAISSIGKLIYAMEIMKSKGSKLHMNGEGGDAVLSTPDSYLIDLLKRGRIGIFLQHLSGLSRLTCFSPLALMSSGVKLSFTSYRQWLLQQAKKLRTEWVSNQELMYGDSISDIMTWDFVPHPAIWYTEKFVNLVLAEIQRWTTVARPFAGSPWRNEYMAELHLTGLCTRILQQVAEASDVNLEFPYLDSLVIDACLSAKPEDRKNLFAYKPLLSKALDRDLPKSIFTRNTKNDYTVDESTGFQQNLGVIKELFQTSLLADMGLIDIRKFRAAIEQFGMVLNNDRSLLNTTMGVELWLRRVMNGSHRFWM